LGIKKVVLPSGNKDDVLHLGDVVSGMDVVFVEEILDAVPHVLGR
jgi:predicted ATP-dependent protease